MSAEATGWTWKHSPYEGERLLVHLAIADVVNDAHGNEFWMTTTALAKKARVSRSTATTVLSDMCHRELLEVVMRGVGRGNSTTYRMLMPPGTKVTVGRALSPTDPTTVSARPARGLPDQSARAARTLEPEKVRADASQSARPEAPIEITQERRTEEPKGALRVSEPTPPPWTRGDLTFDEWVRSGSTDTDAEVHA